MRFSHLDLFDGQKWFISLEVNGNHYHSDAITQYLQLFTSLTFKEIALNFGAFIDDDYDYEEYFFEYEEDCVRCMNFLNDLISN